MYSPTTAGKIINACVVLHNLLIDNNYPLPPEDEIRLYMDQPDMEPACVIGNALHMRVAGFRARDQVVREFFNR